MSTTGALPDRALELPPDPRSASRARRWVRTQLQELQREDLVDSAILAVSELVANAVMLESEVVLASWYGELGGDLSRVADNRATPVGGFTGWRAMMPVTIWSVTKS